MKTNLNHTELKPYGQAISSNPLTRNSLGGELLNGARTIIATNILFWLACTIPLITGGHQFGGSWLEASLVPGIYFQPLSMIVVVVSYLFRRKYWSGVGAFLCAVAFIAVYWVVLTSDR